MMILYFHQEKRSSKPFLISEVIFDLFLYFALYIVWDCFTCSAFSAFGIIGTFLFSNLGKCFYSSLQNVVFVVFRQIRVKIASCACRDTKFIMASSLSFGPINFSSLSFILFLSYFTSDHLYSKILFSLREVFNPPRKISRYFVKFVPSFLPSHPFKSNDLCLAHLYMMSVANKDNAVICHHLPGRGSSRPAERTTEIAFSDAFIFCCHFPTGHY